MPPGPNPKRKRRSDRLYVIYKITCKPTGETYIGVVVREGTIRQTLYRRLHQHTFRAERLSHEWTLHQRIREHGKHEFRIEMVETVIGKAAAHVREMALIRLYGKLNTHGT